MATRRRIERSACAVQRDAVAPPPRPSPRRRRRGNRRAAPRVRGGRRAPRRARRWPRPTHLPEAVGGRRRQRAAAPPQRQFRRVRRACARALLDALRARGLFGGRAWAQPHRVAWAAASRWPLIRKLVSIVDELPGWVRQPRRMLALRASGRRRRRRPGRADGDGWPTLGDALGGRRRRARPRARRPRVGLRVAAGDVLLIDNRRVMHDGLPGFGPRQLRALFFDAFEMPQAMERRGSGVFDAR